MWTDIRNVDAFDQVTYCEPTLNYHALKSNTTVVLRHVCRVSQPLCCDISLTVCALGSEIRPLDSQNACIALRIKIKMKNTVLCHLGQSLIPPDFIPRYYE